MSTVLIAAPEHLEVLKERDDFSNAQSFSDAEALRALEVITRKRPDVVALERDFAATTRGAALINRIKADPKLASCGTKFDRACSKANEKGGCDAAHADCAGKETAADTCAQSLSPSGAFLD